jgi:hypothetical protein
VGRGEPDDVLLGPGMSAVSSKRSWDVEEIGGNEDEKTVGGRAAGFVRDGGRRW